jgi:hypothetical protein
MPVDAMYVDPMLNPFRDMMKDIDAKKVANKHVDEMRAVLNKMEQLAAEMDDMISYTTKLTTENLFMNFSNAYSAALSAAAASDTSQPTDDAGLLAQSLSAYEGSYKTLKAEPKHKHLLPPLEKLIALGKSGVSYPVYLRMAEEQGLFADMNSGSPGPNIEFDIHCAEVLGYPLQIEMKKKIKAGFEALCAKHPFKIAEPLEFRLMRQKIEWEYAPALAKWSAIVNRWERLISMVDDWLDAHCDFAPRDERWVSLDGAAATARNIARTKECAPGRVAVREGVFKEYFNLSWDDIWTHETYLTDQKEGRIWQSDERLEMIREAYKTCKPGGAPNSDLIKRREADHKAGGGRNARNLERFGTEQNPGPGYAYRDFTEFVG